jgi:hypothetical protein
VSVRVFNHISVCAGECGKGLRACVCVWDNVYPHLLPSDQLDT